MYLVTKEPHGFRIIEADRVEVCPNDDSQRWESILGMHDTHYHRNTHPDEAKAVVRVCKDGKFVESHIITLDNKGVSIMTKEEVNTLLGGVVKPHL